MEIKRFRRGSGGMGGLFALPIVCRIEKVGGMQLYGMGWMVDTVYCLSMYMLAMVWYEIYDLIRDL